MNKERMEALIELAGKMSQEDQKMMRDILNALHEDEIFVSSLADASELLESHMGANDGKYRRRLINFITDPENRVMSSGGVYHNFLMDLFHVKEYDIALKVCDYGLEAGPHHMDLLADAMKACGESSQFKRGEEYLAVAMEIPKRYWSWRLFCYSIDYMAKWLAAEPENDTLYERAQGLAKEFIYYFPYDEHGYNQRAELMIATNRREEAIADLKRSILEIHPDEKDSCSQLVCAQCCLTLLNLLDDSNDYDFIIKICDRGLRDTTQEQPSASAGYFMYRKAMALDAKAHCENFRVPVTISDALACYQAAFDLNQDIDFRRTIQQRYAVLRVSAVSAGVEFKPLMKRPYYIEVDGKVEKGV